MTNHPITPPIDLVRQWSDSSPIQYEDELWAYELFIAQRAAQWGADQELEACCKWLEKEREESGFTTRINPQNLRAARRPPSLKEQALAILDDCSSPYLDGAHENIIRRALEQLND